MIPSFLNGHVKIVNVELQYYTKKSCPWGLQGTKEDADKLDVTVSHFSVVSYFSVHYWKLCFWSSNFWENVHESRLVANCFNAHFAWITCKTFWFHHQTSFTSNSDGFHDTYMMLPDITVSRKHKLLCFHCWFNQSNMILKVIWMCFHVPRSNYI